MLQGSKQQSGAANSRAGLQDAEQGAEGAEEGPEGQGADAEEVPEEGAQQEGAAADSFVAALLERTSLDSPTGAQASPRLSFPWYTVMSFVLDVSFPWCMVIFVIVSGCLHQVLLV
jgi:hypothetical protein